MTRIMTLAEYSLSAISLMGVNSVYSEVIYTDIEDIELDFNNAFCFLDIDDNGTDDFQFIKFSGSYTWSSSFGETQLRNFDWIIIQPQTSAGITVNEIAGYSFTNYFSYVSYRPFALSNGVLINESIDFNRNEGLELMASRIDILPGAIGWMDGGYWYPVIEDHFVGIHFVDADLNYHYGWIRCSVLDSAEILIIKDFAYETEIEHTILAGDTISYVSVEDSKLNDRISVYSYGSKLYLKLNERGELPDISIYDLNGKNIFTTKLESNFVEIDLNNYPTDYYLISINGKNWNFTKKVFIYSNTQG